MTPQELLRHLESAKHDDELAELTLGLFEEAGKWHVATRAREWGREAEYKAMEKAEGVVSAFRMIRDADRLAAYSHRAYLPVAKQYRECMRARMRGDRHPDCATLARRLGGVSRAMYLRQKDTVQDFKDVLHVIIPFPFNLWLTDHMLDTLWKALLEVERRALSRARGRLS